MEIDFRDAWGLFSESGFLGLAVVLVIADDEERLATLDSPRSAQIHQRGDSRPLLPADRNLGEWD